jgi:hypothetical protein
MILSIDKANFITLCYQLLDKLGKDRNDIVILGKENITGRLYEDELIYIAADEDKTLAEIERKRSKTTVAFIENKEPIAFSPEYVFLIDHVQYLLSN